MNGRLVGRAVLSAAHSSCRTSPRPFPLACALARMTAFAPPLHAAAGRAAGTAGAAAATTALPPARALRLPSHARARPRVLLSATASPSTSPSPWPLLPTAERAASAAAAAAQQPRALSTRARGGGASDTASGEDKNGGAGDAARDARLEIRAEDLDEQFVRGSGPGGQKINKSSVCVVLRHIPTGLSVKCQESRSQMKNRELARVLLARKIEQLVKGELSAVAREESRARAQKARRRRKAVSKHFKSRRDRQLLEG